MNSIKIGLVSIICILSLNNLLLANDENKEETKKETKDKIEEETNQSKYFRVVLATRYTKLGLSKIENVNVDTDPIITGEIGVVLFPGKYDISLGYARSIAKASSDASDSKDITKSSVEDIRLEVPIPMTNFSFLYNKLKANSYLEAGNDKKVAVVKKENTTAKTGHIPFDDPHLTIANPGEKIGLDINLERFEGRYYFGKTDNKLLGLSVSKKYFAIYQETIYRPWEDPTSNWRSEGYPVTLIYGDSKFTSQGISFGLKTNDVFLPTGLSISSASFDLAMLDIDLTDNYSFKDKVGDSYSAYTYSFFGELVYKKKFTKIAKDSYFILGAFAKYNGYRMSKNTSSSNSSESFSLANETLYGLRVAITF